MSLRMNHFLKFYRELLKHKQLGFEDNDITVIVNLKEICRVFLKMDLKMKNLYLRPFTTFRYVIYDDGIKTLRSNEPSTMKQDLPISRLRPYYTRK